MKLANLMIWKLCIFPVFHPQATKRRKSQSSVASSDVAEQDVSTGKSFPSNSWQKLNSSYDF